jgi:protease I
MRHSFWLLIEADAVKGRTVTSWSSLRKDLINAGANWIDQAVVVDNHLITVRNPGDIPEFAPKVVEMFALKEVYAHQSSSSFCRRSNVFPDI